MRAITVGIIGAAALAAGLLLVREIREQDPGARDREVHAGENQPATLSLDRIRALGY